MNNLVLMAEAKEIENNVEALTHIKDETWIIDWFPLTYIANKIASKLMKDADFVTAIKTLKEIKLDK